VVRSRIAAVAVTALTMSLLVAAPAVATGHRRLVGCPKAESLVPGAHLSTRTLAKGVTLSGGTAHDPQGQVVIHVLRVDVSNRHVVLAPLVRSLAERSPLSQLAAHRRHLVAATNTGYFDFRTGAPVGPFITGGRVVMLSTRHQRVAGLGSNGRLEAGDVWLSATVTSGSSAHPLSALNELDPPSGLAVYTRAWGTSVSVRSGAGIRPVASGVVGASSVVGSGGNGGGHGGGHGGGRSNGVAIPVNGELLVATSQSARSWLRLLHSGASLKSAIAVKTSAPVAFTQAYGVGSQIVARAGHPLTGFSCDSSNTRTPARTSIGFAKGGRQLILAVVSDHPRTSVHGLDEDQMSKLMVQLGAASAYAFDGSGSAELLARTPGAASLTLRNYPADGVERPMPLGLGIYTRR
jgi:hypothetical protein